MDKEYRGSFGSEEDGEMGAADKIRDERDAKARAKDDVQTSAKGAPPETKVVKGPKESK